ncbi:MAG TPA: DeoR/GlpR family DNA-binding transcription regulator [Armatimonadota bacterium]|jgi:DeoR family fructose operon transcriptional repressor
MNITNDTFKEERWREILDILSREGRIRVADLAAQLSVSEATVRRDLEAMQAQGMLQRTHGGALLQRPTALEISFDESKSRSLREKRAIGRRAADLVGPGESIIIESGTTTLEMARCLAGEARQLTVLTNSLAIAKELATNEDIEVLVLGGSLRRQSASLVGNWVSEILRNVRVDKAFLGVNGLSPDFGLSAPNVFTAETRKAMIVASRTRIALADHSKLGVESLYRVAPINVLDILVTDAEATEEQLKPFREAEIEVLVG